jgi:prophage tail gpP-like protein
MPKPIPGKQYTIVDEDSLSQVSRRAYGTLQHWPVIWRANKSALQSGDPDLIYPGETIYIPEIAELVADEPDISNREPDEITIVIDGLEIRYSAARVMLTMDTASDGWTATLPWKPGENPALDERLRPYSYAPAKVYVGGILKITGKVYISESETSSDGTLKNLEGFSRTADILDSMMRPPYEENNITLKQRASKLAAPHGIKVVVEANTGGPFDRVTAGETEKKGAHLAKLARERGVLQSSTANGNLLYWEANVDGAPVVTLEEGQFPVGKLSFRADGRRRYSSYQAIVSTPFGASESPPIKDKTIPGSRLFTFRVQDSTAGELNDTAKWERNRALADALTIPIPVVGLLNPRDGKPWEVNKKVTVVSPSLHVPDGFDFIIRAVELEARENEKSSILNIVPPQVYTKEELVEPWA